MSIPGRIIDSKTDHFSLHDGKESRTDQSNSVMKVLIAALFLGCWSRTWKTWIFYLPGSLSLGVVKIVKWSERPKGGSFCGA